MISIKGDNTIFISCKNYDYIADSHNELYKFALNDGNKHTYIIPKITDINPIIRGLDDKYQDNCHILYFMDETQFLNIKSSQITCIGYDIENYDCFNLDILRKKGITNILLMLLEKYKNKHVICAFSMNIFDNTICPTEPIKNHKYFSSHELNEIVLTLNNKVNSLIITNFNLNNENEYAVRLTSEVIQILYKNIMDIKEAQINVFNIHSRFLIFRPLEQTDENDIGWFILRFLSNEQKNKLLSHIPDNTIMILNLDDVEESKIYDLTDDIDVDDVLISVTTIDEQNKKNYYVSNDMTDCCLYPQEKTLMTFELVN